MPGVADELRPERDGHRVGPRRRGPDGDQGVHRHGAVAARAPRGPVEAAAGPELDERRRQQHQLVQRLDPDRGLGHEHHRHDPERRDDGGDGLDQRRALGPIALEVVGRQLGGQGGGGGVGRRRGLRADLVAGGLDGPDERVPARDGRVERDGGPLGGEVDGRVTDPGGLREEALDAVDARGAGHPLDGQDDLDRLAGHTPREYTSADQAGAIPTDPEPAHVTT